MSANLKKMIKAMVEELSECQYVLSDLYIFLAIDKSYGVQLDGVGDIVGISRGGRDDGEYRSAIKFQIFLNISSGEAETLLKAFKSVTGGTNVSINEVFPATVELFSDGSNFHDGINKAMDLLGAGGVRVNTFYVPDDPFIFADEGGKQNLKGKGYNEVSYTVSGIPVGGRYTELIS